MSYNKAVLAQMNKRIVLDMIRTKGPINKAEIARQADLSIPTVMKITEEFERQKLVRTIGKGESTGGKRPDLLEFVSHTYYVVGVDIGRHNIKLVIMDMAAEILEKEYFETTQEDAATPEKLLTEIGLRVQKLIKQAGIPGEKLLGMGIGMPGIIDHASESVIFSPDFNWVNVPLAEVMKKQFPGRIVVENSNRALALGEYTYGAAREAEYVFCINLGHGIGGAIIENGELLYGKSGTSGEFGHMIMDPKGPLCDCGNKGCLEAFSSGNAIAKKMGEELSKGAKSILSAGLKEGKPVDAEMVFAAARTGDDTAKGVITSAMNYLGMAIASCINLLDPDYIVLAGGLTKSQDIFIQDIERMVQQYKMKYSGRNVKIKIGILGEYGTAIGAGTLLIRRLMEHGGKV